MATKETSVCLDKAAPDEQIFVLRAQDVSSPHLVMEWIKMNLETCPEDKLRQAFETALKMLKHKNRKLAD